MAAFDGRVVGVADSDTLSVLRDRTQNRIRLHGIDAPEKGQTDRRPVPPWEWRRPAMRAPTP
jgi:endonuclease YncB( thermonuclease family)